MDDLPAAPGAPQFSTAEYKPQGLAAQLCAVCGRAVGIRSYVVQVKAFVCPGVRAWRAQGLPVTVTLCLCRACSLAPELRLSVWFYYSNIHYCDSFLFRLCGTGCGLAGGQSDDDGIERCRGSALPDIRCDFRVCGDLFGFGADSYCARASKRSRACRLVERCRPVGAVGNCITAVSATAERSLGRDWPGDPVLSDCALRTESPLQGDRLLRPAPNWELRNKINLSTTSQWVIP